MALKVFRKTSVVSSMGSLAFVTGVQCHPTLLLTQIKSAKITKSKFLQGEKGGVSIEAFEQAHFVGLPCAPPSFSRLQVKRGGEGIGQENGNSDTE